LVPRLTDISPIVVGGNGERERCRIDSAFVPAVTLIGGVGTDGCSDLRSIDVSGGQL
jgi:hypothetical protein